MSSDGRSWTTDNGIGVYEFFDKDYVTYEDYWRVVRKLKQDIKDLEHDLETTEGRLSS